MVLQLWPRPAAPAPPGNLESQAPPWPLVSLCKCWLLFSQASTGSKALPVWEPLSHDEWPHFDLRHKKIEAHWIYDELWGSWWRSTEKVTIKCPDYLSTTISSFFVLQVLLVLLRLQWTSPAAGVTRCHSWICARVQRDESANPLFQLPFKIKRYFSPCQTDCKENCESKKSL